MRSKASWISWISSLSFSISPREMSCSWLSVPRSARCMGSVERSPAASEPFLQASSSSVFTSPCSTPLRWSRRALNSFNSLLESPPLTGSGIATSAGGLADAGAGFAAGLLFFGFGFDFGFEFTFAHYRLDPGDIPAVLLELRRVFNDVRYLAEAEIEEALDQFVELLLQLVVGHFLVVFFLRHGVSRPVC